MLGIRSPVRCKAHPRWIKLGFRQCSNCPLKPGRCLECPVVLGLETMLAAFKDTLSHARVYAEFTSPERTSS